MDLKLSLQMPYTTNGIEHVHSLSHRAIGIDQELVPGIKKLHLFIEKTHTEYLAIKAGHFKPDAPRGRNYRAAQVKPWEVNDGRPPDTTETLLQFTAEQERTEPPSKNIASTSRTLPAANSKNGSNTGPKSTLNLVCPPRAEDLISYPWNDGNSCFFDAGLTALFACVESWTPTLRKSILEVLPNESVLATIFWHFQCRTDWLEELPTSDQWHLQRGRTELCFGQILVRHGIFNKLELYPDPGDYGSVAVWIQEAINHVADAGIDQFFSLKHTVRTRCSKPHTSYMPSARERIVCYLRQDDIKLTRQLCGEHATLNDYLEHLIPRQLRIPHHTTDIGA
ncbi:hypothetical protein HWV62_16208 [Athelia sp. TMB]|nr:hypothetical protein HWV62_16208 [Athelia sp. TMB]